MLTIRENQIEAFHQRAIQEFENRMMDHIRKFFPKQLELVGEPEMRALIRHGIRRAESYGITAERDVCKYVDLAVVFGKEFDTNVTMLWARTILGDSTLTSSTQRINRLYDAAIKNIGR
jgi:hypothetical protein